MFGLAYVGLIWVCLLEQMFIELVKGWGGELLGKWECSMMKKKRNTGEIRGS